MTERIFRVELRPPNHTHQVVVASSAEVHGDHLVFLDAQGKLIALFLLDLVANCFETGPSPLDPPVQ
jgi:hypothetical protein